MVRELDLVGAIGQAASDREAAWRFISDFARAWLNAPLKHGGGHLKHDIAVAEERLREPIPIALKEALIKFGDRADLVRSQERLLGPSELQLDDTREVLIYRVENQGAAEWGIPVECLGSADPATVYRLSAADQVSHQWIPWIPRFSLAFVELILWESLFSCSRSLHRQFPLKRGDQSVLERSFTRLGFPEFPKASTVAPCEFVTHWFAGKDIILCSLIFADVVSDEHDPWSMGTERCGDLFVRARTRESLSVACSLFDA